MLHLTVFYMNTPSEGASRDAFLWKAVEQFEGLARWVAEPLKAEAWEDGAEAVFTVRQDDYELLRFTVSFDDDGARSKGWDQKLILTGEWQGEASELLVLGWKGSLPDFEQGLDSRADFAEGKYANAMGAVVQFLRDKLSDALEPKASASSRQVALLPLRKPANMIDTQFEPTPSVARAEPVLPREDQPGVRHAAVLPHMPDLELLRHALDALPEIEALHANAIFAGFIKAAGSPSPLRQGDIVAFVQGGLEDLHAFQEAYLDGGSTLTQAGVGLKGAALIGALAVALGAETMTGVFAFGPIIGHSIEALPLAGVGSFLIGGGLLPMAQTDKARRNIVAVALAWGLAVSSLSAKNDRLAEPVQMAFAKTEETVKTEWLAEAARLKLDGVKEKIRLARDDKEIE